MTFDALFELGRLEDETSNIITANRATRHGYKLFDAIRRIRVVYVHIHEAVKKSRTIVKRFYSFIIRCRVTRCFLKKTFSSSYFYNAILFFTFCFVLLCTSGITRVLVFNKTILNAILLYYSSKYSDGGVNQCSNFGDGGGVQGNGAPQLIFIIFLRTPTTLLYWNTVGRWMYWNR